MEKRLKNFWQMLKTAAKKCMNRDSFREGAIIAYLAIFALPGLLVVVISTAGYFLVTKW